MMSTQDVVSLAHEPINTQAVQDEVEKHNDKGKYGAVLTFAGKVRNVDDHGDRQEHIQAIDYETYTELFIGETLRLITKVRGVVDGQLGPIGIVHRMNTVKVGEITAYFVICAVHRRDAIKALELIIDGMKSDVPIWKKIIRRDGEAKLVRTIN